MFGDNHDPANRLEKGVGDTWYVFYHSQSVNDEAGRARTFESEADATECLLRCELAGRIIQ